MWFWLVEVRIPQLLSQRHEPRQAILSALVVGSKSSTPALCLLLPLSLAAHLSSHVSPSLSLSISLSLSLSLFLSLSPSLEPTPTQTNSAASSFGPELVIHCIHSEMSLRAWLLDSNCLGPMQGFQEASNIRVFQKSTSVGSFCVYAVETLCYCLQFR